MSSYMKVKSCWGAKNFLILSLKLLNDCTDALQGGFLSPPLFVKNRKQKDVVKDH